MTWLRTQLENIKDQDKAIIIMHLPPGKDGFKKAEEVELWDPTLGGHDRNVQQQFRDLVATYRDRIVGILAGHSHKDGVRVLYKEGKPTKVLFSIPSISPVYFNNPGFKMIAYDPATLQWIDMVTYYTDQLQYKQTEKWTLDSYSLRKILSLKGGALDDGIMELAKKDPAGLTKSISRIYYVRSRHNKVNNMDDIGRTIFVGK